MTVVTNGVELFLTDEGAGPPVILLHGFTGSSDNWKLIFPNGVDGHRTLAFDLRGHGRSTNAPGTFTFRECARDVLGVLDHLKIDRVKAIGMSLGAKTLLHMATMEPSRLEAMVLVSATPRFPEQARVAMRAMADDANTKEPFKAMVLAMANGQAGMDFDAATLGTITARTLIVHGDRDPLYPVELALEMNRAIPQSQLWVVPNGGHGPIFGGQSAAFASAAVNFLKPAA
jgi:pimeloyl-ACP methyl ester carboxylesterase